MHDPLSKYPGLLLYNLFNNDIDPLTPSENATSRDDPVSAAKKRPISSNAMIFKQTSKYILIYNDSKGETQLIVNSLYDSPLTQLNCHLLHPTLLGRGS